MPLVVNGRMYVSWPFCHVAALDPKPVSSFGNIPRPIVLTGARVVVDAKRGLLARRQGAGSAHSFGTEEGELYALDAKTGVPVDEFGVKGIVNLKTREVMKSYPRMHYGVTSAPLVYEDLLITGSHIDEKPVPRDLPGTSAPGTSAPAS